MREALCNAIQKRLGDLMVSTKVFVGTTGTSYYLYDGVVGDTECESKGVKGRLVTKVEERDATLVLVRYYSMNDGTGRTTIVRPELSKIIGKMLECYTELDADKRSASITPILDMFKASQGPFELDIAYAASFPDGYKIAADQRIESCMDHTSVDFYECSPVFRLLIIRVGGVVKGRAIIVHLTPEAERSKISHTNDPLNNASESGWSLIRLYTPNNEDFYYNSRMRAQIIAKLPHISGVCKGWAQGFMPNNQFLPYLDAGGDYLCEESATAGDVVFAYYSVHNVPSRFEGKAMYPFEGSRTDGNRFYANNDEDDGRCECVDCGNLCDGDDITFVYDCAVCPQCIRSNYVMSITDEYIHESSAMDMRVKGRLGSVGYVSEDNLPISYDGYEWVLATNKNGDVVAAREDECIVINENHIFDANLEDYDTVPMFKWNMKDRCWIFADSGYMVRKDAAHGWEVDELVHYGDGWARLERESAHVSGIKSLRMTFVCGRGYLVDDQDRGVFMYANPIGRFEMAATTVFGRATMLTHTYSPNADTSALYNYVRFVITSDEDSNALLVTPVVVRSPDKTLETNTDYRMEVSDPYLIGSVTFTPTSSRMGTYVIVRALEILMNNGHLVSNIHELCVDPQRPQTVFYRHSGYMGKVVAVNTYTEIITTTTLSEWDDARQKTPLVTV